MKPTMRFSTEDEGWWVSGHLFVSGEAALAFYMKLLGAYWLAEGFKM